MMDASLFGGFTLLVSLFSGGLGLPLGVPPVEDPLMAKVAPEECLAYVSWSGMGVADPASANSTEKMMAGPEVQRILGELDRRIAAALLAIPADDEASPQALLAKEGVPLGRLLLSRPTALFIEKVGEGEAGPDVRGGALVNLGEDAPKVQASLEKLQQQFLKEAVAKVEVAGLAASQITLGRGAPEITWAIKGNYLFVGVGPGSLEGVIKRASTPAPQWLTGLRESASIERVSSIIHVDTAKLQELPFLPPDLGPMLAGTGLNKVQAVGIVSGLNKEAFLSQTKLTLAGEAAGLATIVSDKSLSPLDLETIPVDATLAVAVRADAPQLFATIQQIAGNFEPGAPDEMERELRRIEEQTGVKIVDGIFRGIGDVWCAYNSPSEGGVLFTGLTATVNVRDYDRLKPEYDKLHKILSDEFERQRGFRDGRGPQVKEIEFAGEKIHFITGERDFVVTPSFCLTKDYFIFSLFPQNIQALLSRGDDFKSLATSPHVGPHMKMSGGPSVIVYQDTRELFKMLYPLVPMMGRIMASEMGLHDTEFDLSLLPSVKAIAPHLHPGLTTLARTEDAVILESRNTLPGGLVGAGLPIVAGMYLPSMGDAFAAASRTQSSNNLKQIALALHLYHDVNGHFPPAFTVDKEGKPLLSWRVAILPYIEERRLFDEFHQDEPWDSEHNKKLLARMPAIFHAPTSKSGDTTTVYLAPRVERGVISGVVADGAVEKVRIANVTDGTSNTIMVLETSDERAVDWTKPDDLAVDPKDSKAGVAGQHKRGFLAAFTDGSVQFLSHEVDAETMTLLFDRGDGQPVNPWQWSADARRGGARASVTHEVPAPVEEEPAFEEFSPEIPEEAPVP
jgi:hypothetical protein